MPDRIVDLRSDTVTRPTEAMREAMARAEVGDDVYGEDPTVNQLQELAADRLGTEAALFVPTGTMGNTCALLAHTRPGDEFLVEESAHIYYWECGNYATIAGLAVRPIRGEHGILTAEAVEAALRGPNLHFPPPRLVCVENTHNNAAGSAWTPEQLAALATRVHARGLALHMDGARLFHAAVALGVDPRAYTQHVDSVMICVSKGLSAPVGSLLCGTRAFIDRAVPLRKRLGGGMRQAGIIAAAGIVALESMVERLAEDHLQARRLAAGLAALPGVAVRQPPVPTNILVVEVTAPGWNSERLVSAWRAMGVLSNARPPLAARLVTHRHISAADVDYVIEVTGNMLAAA